jgi:hypothetical protein
VQIAPPIFWHFCRALKGARSSNIRRLKRIVITASTTPTTSCGIAGPLGRPNFGLKNGVAGNFTAFQNEMRCRKTIYAEGDRLDSVPKFAPPLAV